MLRDRMSVTIDH